MKKIKKKGNDTSHAPFCPTARLPVESFNFAAKAAQRYFPQRADTSGRSRGIKTNCLVPDVMSYRRRRFRAAGGYF